MRSRRPARLVVMALFVAITACAQADAPAGDAAADSAAFVTLLGTDTLVVERFITHPERVEAEVLIRTPSTQLRRYVLERDADGSMRRMEAHAFAGSDVDGAPLRSDVLDFGADSLTVTVTRDGEPETTTVAGHRAVVPFLDMIHWPFDVVLRQMAADHVDSLTVDMFVGRRTAPFVVRRMGTEQATITHPSRGTMNVQTDATGRLTTLDAGATTRKLTVERKSWIDMDPLLARYAELDAQGRSFGPLSGRGESVATLSGAEISLDYGTPVKRGREIWGALVKYGEVWRTGANRATHFETSQPLEIGGLEVPAGRYTLYSVPGESESVLIVNTMTDQGGTTYDESMDLGRVTLQHRAAAETYEVFTISVTPDGELVLAWDDREMFVPVRVL